MRMVLVLGLAFLLLACAEPQLKDPFEDSRTGSATNGPHPNASWITLSQGELSGIDHVAEGTIKVMEREGVRILEFTRFKTERAPDLRVYLTKDGTLTGAVDLGPLKHTIGDQTYEVPESVSLLTHGEVLIYCRAFHVPFGTASLS